MSNVLADERTIIDRLLNHIDAKSTDLSDDVWHEPAAHYASPERFQAEVHKVMRRTATPFCPSAALPEPGSYVARDAALTPIVAVRGHDGKVRAFRNACRHRGAQVVADGAGCKSALTCRYHAWTYGLDGQLRGVPHEYGFPGLDKSRHGLVPVAAFEKHGLVFVTQDGADTVRDEEPLPDFFGPEWRLISAFEAEFETNWKIFIDGLLEGYHIRSTHAETFYPRQYDNITTIEYSGRNSRVTYPYRSIEKERALPAHERKASRAMTHVTHIFPNTAVASFPTHVTLVAVEPLTVARCKVVNYTLTNRAESDSGSVSKGRDFVTAGTLEDREVGMAVQRGLATNANEVFTFGLFEGALRHFHRNLAAALA